LTESSGQSGFYKLGRDFNKIVAVGKRFASKLIFLQPGYTKWSN